MLSHRPLSQGSGIGRTSMQGLQKYIAPEQNREMELSAHKRIASEHLEPLLQSEPKIIINNGLGGAAILNSSMDLRKPHQVENED